MNYVRPRPVNSIVGCLLLQRRVMILTLSLIILALTTNGISGVPQARKSTKVSQDFSYPDTPHSIEYTKPVLARSLSGRIYIPFQLPVKKKEPVARALVERMTDDWKTRLDATLSDEQGYFRFANVKEGSYHLKVSKPGYASLKLVVVVSSKSKGLLGLPLVACCVMS